MENNMGVPYEAMDFGSIVIKYTFKEGEKLPEVGTVINDDRTTMVVTESCKEERYIKVTVTSTESISNRIEQYKKEVDEKIDEIGNLIYKRTTKGMIALIGWEKLPNDLKKTYTTLAKDIIEHLDKAGLLILKYEDILI